jgi:hypothetical protein
VAARLTALNRSSLDASSVVYDGTGRLATMLHKLATGRRVQVVALGASVTFGHGLQNAGEAAWPEQLAAGLRAAYGYEDIHVLNAAQPATTGGFASLCFDVLVPPHTDLVLLEYGYTTRDTGSFELLLRTALARDAAVLALDYAHPIARNKLWWGCNAFGGPSALDHNTQLPCTPQRLVLPQRCGSVKFRSVLERWRVPTVSSCVLAALYAEQPLDVTRWFIAESDLGHPSELGQFQLAQSASAARQPTFFAYLPTHPTPPESLPNPSRIPADPFPPPSFRPCPGSPQERAHK